MICYLSGFFSLPYPKSKNFIFEIIFCNPLRALKNKVNGVGVCLYNFFFSLLFSSFKSIKLMWDSDSIVYPTVGRQTWDHLSVKF